MIRDAALPGGLVAALRPLGPAPGFRPAWRALGEAPFLANPFYEAGYALAAAPAYGAGVDLLLVADRAPEMPGARLLALWPFRRARARWGLPLPVLAGWMHDHGVLGVPLLDAREPARALAALLAAPRALALSPRLLMPYLPTEGPFAELLRAERAASGARETRVWAHARARLALDGLGPEARGAALAHLSARRRRKLRAAGEALEAGGEALRLDTADEPAALAAALEDFIALEAAGWKGRMGTAIACRPQEAAFLRAMTAALGAEGRLRIDRLRLGGQTLAAAILPRTGADLWFLKIAHDEGTARHSPGVQLVHRLSRDWLADPSILRVDSCAAPGTELAEMFWTGRARLAHHLIEAPGGDPLFPLAAALERARARIARMRAETRAKVRAARQAGPPDPRAS
ncbi:GNAT family N-acetyltransferase [Methylobacterium durans]|uniref:GNAT family N-acetyltransferase n=1 Tax=Methylobacterium durans TaxID=2202825 RepID=A0A2U8WDI2_9HYPH|nr:GNAT family N-acetyltransferase [Methylobacterium durans]AWN43510.1 GNAT family N-acetyltransferase [Methylobacterium durans]